MKAATPERLPAFQSKRRLRLILRYGSAIVAVAVAFLLRQAITAQVGPGLPPYIIFAAAAIFVVLFAGFGPGVLATLLTDMVAAYWILEPVGQFRIASPVDRLGMMIYTGVSLFFCAIVEFYRRNRDKVAAFERDAALRESRERLAVFAEVTFEGIVESEAGRIVDCNEQLARMLGYSVEELKGMDIASLIVPEDRDRVMANILLGRDSAIEQTALCKDGTRIVVEAHGRPAFPGSTRRYTTIRDITVRKQADEAMRESEERYRLLFQNLQEGFYLADAIFDDGGKCCDAVYLDVNPAFERIMSRPRDQIVGKRVKELVPQIKPEWLEVFGKVTQTGEPISYQAYSEQFRQHFEALVFRPAPGRFGVLVTDITERKRTEEALRQSEVRYRTLFDTMTEGFALHEIITDDRGQPCDYRFLDINPSFERLTGLKRDAVVGKRVQEVLPKNDPYWIETYGKVALTGEPIHLENFSTPLNRWYEVFAYQTAPGQFAVIFTDITARKQAESALQISVQRFYSILSGMYSGVLLVTDDGRVEFANQAICDRFDLEVAPTDLVGLNSHEMIEKIKHAYLDPEEAVVRIREIVDRGQPVKGEEIAMRGGGACLRDFVPLSIDGKSYGRLWLHVDITKRKQAEEAHRESERRERERAEELAVLFEAVPIPVFIARDPDCLHLTGNRLADEILRIPQGNELSMSGPVETRPHHFKVMKDGRELRLDELPAQRAARGEHIKDFDFSLVFDDGVVHHVLGYGTPLLDDQGRPRGTVATLVDITERKQAEETLRKSEQEFRDLAESMPQIVWATRPDGWNIYFNQQWMDYTGLKLDESYGHGWNAPFHPDDKQRAWDAWQRATKHGENYLLECRLRRFDGVYRWWLIHGTPIRDMNGEILKWIGTCTDIEEIKQAEERLRDSEQQFRALADSIPNLAWWANGDGYITWYNRRWYEYTGTTPAQMEGWGWQTVHDPDELPRVLKRWKAAIAEGKPWEDTFPLRRHDGTLRPHLSRAVPICDREGRVIRWFGTNTDVTEQVETEKALQRAKEAADAANDAKSQFLANMSHELRTPMNAILGMIDLALPKATDPTVQDCLQTAKGSADLLLTLLNDLLDSAKIESGKLELESSPFSLRRMLDQITRVLAVRASEKGLCFYSRMPNETPDAVVGDRMRLQQVLLNLAGNAIKFTEHGDVEIDIHAQSQDGEACLEFAVRDSGIGIPPSSLEHLFQPFAQADASMSRRFGGTGLGLSICKSLVEVMGGKIWVESEVGKGSTFHFTVRLPLAKELPADFGVPLAVPAVACAPLRVLLVEDNPANQKLAAYILQDRGHNVEIAGDGQEAVYLTEQNRYDVILMDVQMPGMNGVDATTAIRKRENGENRVPIIAMTAHAMKGDRDRCLAAGMDGYLSKPINAQEMIAILETMAASSPSVAAGAAQEIRAPETTAIPAPAVFDPKEAMALCYNNEDLVREMIQCFFTEVDILFPQMRAALEKGDLEEFGRLGHRLKGTIVYLGAEPVKRAAMRVEQFCKSSDGTASEAEEAINSLEHECKLLRAALAECTLAADLKPCD